jgi:hypothetical protein
VAYPSVKGKKQKQFACGSDGWVSREVFWGVLMTMVQGQILLVSLVIVSIALRVRFV